MSPASGAPVPRRGTPLTAIPVPILALGAGILAAWALAWAASGARAQDFDTLKGHGGPIMALAISETGQLASASFDNSVGLWEGHRPTWLEGHGAAVTALAWGPGGILVSGGDDFAVRTWMTEGPGGTGETGADAPRELGRHRGKVAALAVAPDGQTVASGSWDGSIRIWPLDGSPSRDLPAPGAAVNALAYDRTGTRLYAGTSAGVLLVYELSDGSSDGSSDSPSDQAPRALARHGFGVNEIVTGPGWIAYGATDGGTRALDPETGEELADLTLERRPILAMTYAPATGQLAVGDGQGYIMVVDTADWSIARDFRATREGPVWALAFSPDGAVIHAGGLDDVIYGWPVALLDRFDPAIDGRRSFLRDAETMPNGERQFMRKCSICHALDAGPSRKAGPSLHGVFGRRAGTLPGYSYSPVLDGSDIVWNETTIDALFDRGPDHYIPGSRMPMQVIAGPDDRADLIAFLRTATGE